MTRQNLLRTGLLLAGGVALASLFKPREQRQSENLQDFEREKRDKGQQPSYSPYIYDGMANTIHAAIGPFTWNDQRKVMQVLARIKNDVDVINLIRAYGRRPHETNPFGFGAEMRDLQTAIKMELDPELIMRVNKDYRWNGISHQW